MRTVWYLIYNIIGVPFLFIFFGIYSIFNSKVRDGLKDRRDLFIKLSKSLLFFKTKNKNVVIHSSSLGEYQQALPLVEEFRKKNYNVILSFFSPSGFNNSKIKSEDVIK
ncbi:MAG: 3-deoxy-D-manno-octulosonic acid transferase, partial [Ignavibacteria bacterium]|nr:3-deoxy-D-manno-octulosonic acid transferase [Ignavibacteria bacterium]